MKTVLEHKYHDVLFDEANQILKAVWKKGNGNITELEMREAVSANVEMILQYKPTAYIASDALREFPIIIELQNWVAQVMAQACIEVGLVKFGMVLPKDFVAELSTEQTVEEAGKLPFELRYFYTEWEATEWIVKGD